MRRFGSMIVGLAVLTAGCSDSSRMLTPENHPANEGARALTLSANPSVIVKPSDIFNGYPAAVPTADDAWYKADTRTEATVSIAAEPASPSLGTGSVKFTSTCVISGCGQAKSQLFTYVFAGTKLADLTTLQYKAYKSSSSTNSAGQTVGLNMRIDLDGDPIGTTTDVATLVFEPVYQSGGVGAIQTNAWQTWDAINAGTAKWFSTVAIPGVATAFTTYVTWSTILANNPNAIFTSVGYNHGSGWTGTFVAYSDEFKVGTASGTATFDFEPSPACTTTCYVDAVGGNDLNGGSATDDAKKTIQAAVTAVTTGGTVIVGPGAYTEKVSIASKNLTLKSSAGLASTSITAPAGTSTIEISGTTTGVTIGGSGEGFTLNGSDGASAAVELASVYVKGTHSNLRVLGNKLVANGEAGYVSEFGAIINGVTIDGNEFAGRTFTGTPFGDGFLTQFTEQNVPRQLVVMGGSNGGGNTQNVTFTNNIVSGISGGINSAGNPQGNTLATIDVKTGLIRGNSFTGFTNGFASSLRVRGPNTTILNNRFTAGSPAGIFVGLDAAHTVLIRDNIFKDNTVAINIQSTATKALNLSNNYWGKSTAPTLATGASVADILHPVGYAPTVEPYVTAFVDASPAPAAGFFPTSVSLNTGAATVAVNDPAVGSPSITLAPAAEGTTPTVTVTPITATKEAIAAASESSFQPFLVTGTTLVIDIDVSGAAPAANGKYLVCVNGTAPSRLFHYNGTVWEDITDATLSVGGKLCGYVTSFSPFAVAQAKTATTTTLSSSDASSFAGQSITLTAAVTPASGTITSGTLSIFRFYSETDSSSVAACNASDPCTYTTDTLSNGTATFRAVYSGDDSFDASFSAKLDQVVALKTTTTHLSCSNVTFTGSAQTPCTATVKYEGTAISGASATITYSSNTDAGTASATATFTATSEYAGSSSGAVTFTIAKAATTTAVTCTAGPFTYTGSAITPCSVSVIGAGGLSLTPAPTYSSNVNAGTATASYTYAESANHLTSTDSKTFTIAKAATTATVTCTGSSFTYTGAAITPCSASVTGAGLNLTSLTPTYSNNTAVGTATASYTYAESANHLGSTNSRTFTITAASAGMTHIGTTYFTSATGIQLTVTMSGASACYAGKTVQFKRDSDMDGSYDLTIASNTISGTSASVTTTLASGVYDIQAVLLNPDANCVDANVTAPSSAINTTFAIVVAGTGDSSNGGGSYSSNGRANFGYNAIVKAATKTTPQTVTGRMLWHVNGKNRIQGAVTGYTKSTCPTQTPSLTGTTCGTIIGTGTLYRWNSTTMRWDVVATNQSFTVTVADGGVTSSGKKGSTTTTTNPDFFRMSATNVALDGETPTLVETKGNVVVK